MNYEDLKAVREYVTKKTGIELKLKYSKFLTEKKLEKQQDNFLDFFDFTAKNGRDRLMQRKHAKERIEFIRLENEKKYIIEYRKNMRNLPICDDKVTESSTPEDFKPLTLKEHGKQAWFSCRKPFENDSVKDCLLRCVNGLKKEIETGDFEALSEQGAGIEVKLINVKAKTGGVK